MDRELWVVLEEVQERNQALAAENTALRARTPTGAWKCASLPVPEMLRMPTTLSTKAHGPSGTRGHAILTLWGSTSTSYIQWLSCVQRLVTAKIDSWAHYECDERSASEAELAIENERLHRQLAAVMELRTAELNEDNLCLINYLTEVRPPHCSPYSAAQPGCAESLHMLHLASQ